MHEIRDLKGFYGAVVALSLRVARTSVGPDTLDSWPRLQTMVQKEGVMLHATDEFQSYCYCSQSPVIVLIDRLCFIEGSPVHHLRSVGLAATTSLAT